MTVGYTSGGSGEALDFADSCLFAPHICLLSASCLANQCFASNFLQIPPHGGHTCRATMQFPSRICLGLQPVGDWAPQGAQKDQPEVGLIFLLSSSKIAKIRVLKQLYITTITIDCNLSCRLCCINTYPILIKIS